MTESRPPANPVEPEGSDAGDAGGEDALGDDPDREGGLISNVGEDEGTAPTG